jgi:hypothetical protein
VLDEAAIAVNPAGAAGTLVQAVGASVTTLACVEAAEVPAASIAFTV